MNAAVLGLGAWGTALALHLARRHRVRGWCRGADLRAALARERRHPQYPDFGELPADFELAEDPAECAAGADWTVLAVPVAALAEVAGRLRGVDCGGLVWTCKGLDAARGRWPSELLDEALGPGGARAVLSGPSFADELAAGQPTAAVAAAAEPAVARGAAELFHHGAFRVYAGDDPTGAQLGGAVKNVLAIAVGVAAGLGLGDNARAALVTRGLHELARLGAVLGAKPATLTGLTGLGDAVLSCAGPHSRNFRLGELVGGGRDAAVAAAAVGGTVEGPGAARALERLARAHGLELPICAQVAAVLDGRAAPADAVAALLARPPRAEAADA